ncbi:hypothetical protein PSJ58_00535 [Escherichia coli]|nr:hypothetical protein [Escherichia coli]
MDEQITLTQNQIFSASLKVSKSRSLVKRRMQSLGLKFTESQDVRNRLAGIEKGALKCVGQFCHDNDAESLSAMAIILSELFLLQGELSTSNEYGDHETSYWTVAQGPCDEWVQSLLASENGRRTFNSFRITFDNSEERRSLVEKMPKCWGVIYCLILSILQMLHLRLLRCLIASRLNRCNATSRSFTLKPH